MLTSQSISKIMRVLIEHPCHVRGIQRETGEQINSIRRSLSHLSESNLVEFEKIGMMKIFKIANNPVAEAMVNIYKNPLSKGIL